MRKQRGSTVPGRGRFRFRGVQGCVRGRVGRLLSSGPQGTGGSFYDLAPDKPVPMSDILRRARRCPIVSMYSSARALVLALTSHRALRRLSACGSELPERPDRAPCRAVALSDLSLEMRMGGNADRAGEPVGPLRATPRSRPQTTRSARSQYEGPQETPSVSPRQAGHLASQVSSRRSRPTTPRSSRS